MASVGRDATVEGAIAAVGSVLGVEVAIIADGMPGRTSARIAVLVDESLRTGRSRAMLERVVRAAVESLRAAHGSGVRGSIAVAALVDGERRAVPPDELIAACGLQRAMAAGDDVLIGPATRLPGDNR